MPTPAESDKLLAQVQYLAETQVNAVKAHFNTTLDYTEAALGEVDRIISTYFPNEGVIETTVLGFGAYVGETIRRTLGGTWVQGEDDSAWLENIGGQDVKVSPFGWVQRRFGNGMEDALAFKYTALMKILDEETVTVPAPAPAAPASAKPAPPAPAAGLKLTRAGSGSALTHEERSSLVRAVALAAVMLAMENGRLIDKRIEKLCVAFSNADVFGCAPFQETLAELQAHFEHHIKQVIQCAGGLPGALEEFGRAREILDTKCGAEAETFKLCWVGLLATMAQGSSGFLGMGKGISRHCLNKIEVIGLALGLPKEELEF